MPSTLTTREYLASRTAMPEGTILHPDHESLEKSLWNSDQRRALHEEYWGNFLLNHLKSIPSTFDFDDAWASLHYHEFLQGSGDGTRFLKQVTGWRSFFYSGRKLTHLVDQVSFPFLPFLYRGKVEKISLRVMCMLRKQIIGSLLDGIEPHSTTVFDLGSGWGRHSLMFAKAYPELKVIAGELSSGGQEITRWFADRFGLAVDSFNFDYLKWSDMVNRVRDCDQNNIVIFSSHSIEQVTFVDLDMWKSLSEIKKSITFIHLEPVGWQFKDNAKSVYTHAPDSKQEIQWGYNKNFLAVVDSLNATGHIKDLSVFPDFLAFGNTFNSGSLIYFRNRYA